LGTLKNILIIVKRPALSLCSIFTGLPLDLEVVYLVLESVPAPALNSALLQQPNPAPPWALNLVTRRRQQKPISVTRQNHPGFNLAPDLLHHPQSQVSGTKTRSLAVKKRRIKNIRKNFCQV